MASTVAFHAIYVSIHIPMSVFVLSPSVTEKVISREYVHQEDVESIRKNLAIHVNIITIFNEQYGSEFIGTSTIACGRNGILLTFVPLIATGLLLSSYQMWKYLRDLLMPSLDKSHECQLLSLRRTEASSECHFGGNFNISRQK
jgi:hypothetical protein